MNITHYEVDSDLDEVLEQVLDYPEFEKAKEHIKVFACFKVTQKTVGTDGDTDTFELVEPKDGETVTLKKIPPEIKVLMPGANDQPWVLIVVDKYFWDECKAEEKKRALHSYIAKLEAKEAKDGGFKVAIKPWEIQCNTSTVKRFGVDHDPNLQRFDEMLASVRVRRTPVADAPVQKQLPAKAASKPAPAAKPAPKAPAKSSVAEMPSDEDPMPGDEPDDPPRVRMAELPLKSKASPLKASKNDEKEKTAPARKPPVSAPVEDEEAPEPDA